MVLMKAFLVLLFAVTISATEEHLGHGYQIVPVASKEFAVYRGIGGQPLTQAWAVTPNNQILELIDQKLSDALNARAIHQAIVPEGACCRIRVELLHAEHSITSAWSPRFSASLVAKVSIDGNDFAKIFQAEASHKAWRIPRQDHILESRRDEAADILVKRILEDQQFMKILLK